MKKLMMMTALAAASLLPQAAKADDTHLNLWPLLSVEDGEADFIWPLGHYESPQEWRFFPIIKDRSLFCVFPELWFAEDIFAILPLIAANDFGAGALFPVLWWSFFEGSGAFHSVFPLYWYNRHGSDALTFWAGCGLLGCTMGKEGFKSHWALPLYAKTPQNFYSLPYSYVQGQGDAGSTYFLGGLAGREQNANGETTEHWCLPLYHKDLRSFTSLPYSSTWNDKDEMMSWLSVPALSGGWQDRDTWNEIYLLGLGGRTEEADRGFTSSWALPLYYANSEGTLVTPVYGRTPSAQWGLPGWYRDAHTFASPFWFHHTDGKDRLDRWMIPLLLSGGVYRDGSRTNGFLLNAAGWRTDDNGFAMSWCFPFYYADNDGTFITPLYGHNKTSQWCFPLWYADETSVYSPLWCSEKNEDGSLKSWFVPPLLSGCTTKKDGTHEARFLLGLGGAEWGGRRGGRSSWVFPFYYENDDGTFVTPLCGRDGRTNWVLPLYFYDGDCGDFVSLPYMKLSHGDRSNTYAIPPLLSWYTAYDDGADERHALLLYGHKNDSRGDTEWDFLLPFYYYDGVSGDFRSLIYGRDSADDRAWWLTPLVGTYTGEKSGGWIFPLFNRKKDADFDRDLAYLEAETLPQGVLETSVSSKVTGSVLIGSDHDHSVSGRNSGSYYEMSESSKQGNRIFFNHELDRRVSFDRTTGKRVGESVDSETMALCGLFYREHEANTLKGTSHTHTRVLWKLWDREETNGDVTLDAFPGFSHVSKKDGTSRTSFLWRFFRHEHDPKRGTSVDLFFIPVWRP